jgi:hypothetical protein
MNNSFNESKMTLEFVLEDIIYEIPAKYEVCSTCGGKGKYVNPAIDNGGIPVEEFHNDPEFAEAYFGGVYDIVCEDCGGKRVIPVIDRDNLNDERKEVLIKIEEQEEEDDYYRRECEAERRMGA